MEIERATVCAYVVRFILYSNNIVDLTSGMGEGDLSFVHVGLTFHSERFTKAF